MLQKTEFALVVGRGTDAEQGLFSDDDEDTVRAHKAILRAQGDRREMVIVQRDCEYPTDKNGKPLALGSTCKETVI